jgi:hypothetical protein
MTDLNFILQEKERALEYAEREVVELKQQVQSLRQTIAMLGTTTLFESALKTSQNKTVEATEPMQSHNLLESPREIIESYLEKSSKPRGALSQAIINTLSDGVIRDGNEVFNSLDPSLNTTLRSVQVTLVNLRKAGRIKSVEYGKYQSIKDESPTIGVVGDSIL